MNFPRLSRCSNWPLPFVLGKKIQDKSKNKYISPVDPQQCCHASHALITTMKCHPRLVNVFSSQARPKLRTNNFFVSKPPSTTFSIIILANRLEDVIHEYIQQHDMGCAVSRKRLRTDKEEQTALAMAGAAAEWHDQVVEATIARIFFSRWFSHKPYTMLHIQNDTTFYSAEYHQGFVVASLLKAGANRHLLDGHGENYLMRAACSSDVTPARRGSLEDSADPSAWAGHYYTAWRIRRTLINPRRKIDRRTNHKGSQHGSNCNSLGRY